MAAKKKDLIDRLDARLAGREVDRASPPRIEGPPVDAASRVAVGDRPAGEAAIGTTDGASAIAVPASPDDGGPAPEFDESMESAFLAEARERGEPVVPPKAREEPAEENETRPLPPLNELVERIPPEVRETLEDLFRARFITVKRVPKRALKS